MFKNSKGQLVTAEEAAADLNVQLDEAEKALQLEKYKSPLDERAAFEAHESKERRLSPADQRTWFRRGAIADYDCKAIDDAWKAWQARAALQSVMEWTAAENVPDDRKLCLIRNAARAGLEQHSRKCPTCDSSGEADSGGVMPWAEAAMLPCPNCAQPSPAPELELELELELERIGSLISIFRNATRNDAENGGREYFEEARSAEQELRQEIDRIVGALRAEVSSWRETLRFNESCWAEERGVMVDKIQALRAGIPLAIASVEDGAVMITGIEDRLFKALSEQTHWKRKTASLELYAAPVAKAGQVPEALRDAVEYLDENSLNQIGSGSKLHSQMRDALAAATGCTEETFPSPQKQSKPCGECRLPEGERCDICGAKATA